MPQMECKKGEIHMKNTISIKVKIAMSDAGMTARELARSADIGETTVYALLSGLRGANVGFGLIDAIAHATNKPLDFFSTRMPHQGQKGL